MIVPMAKVYVAARRDDRDALIDALRDLGLLHLIPVDPEQTVLDDKTAHDLDAVDRAEIILSNVEATQDAHTGDLAIEQAIEETLRIHRQATERSNRLGSLHRQLDDIELWGETKLSTLDALAAMDLEPSFYIVANDEVAAFDARCAQPLRATDKNHTLVAIVGRNEEAALPESATPLEKPDRDRAEILAEAASIDAELKSDKAELARLATLLPAIRREKAARHAQADWTLAARGGLDAETLFAVQGWVPADEVDTLAKHVQAKGVPCAVSSIEPEEGEDPPTLVRYPKWVKPIKALFDILGTTPGYREFDLAPIFMIAMPIFSAMLIGDAGYGLLFLLVGLWKGKALAKATGNKDLAHMILLFAVMTIIWGVLTANYFGVGPKDVGPGLSAVMQSIGVLWRSNDDAARLVVIKISFLLGVIHLVTAHVKQVLALLPDPRALGELGWCSFLIGMFSVVWMMFSPDPVFPMIATYILLGGGFALVVLFSRNDKNPVVRLSLGLLGNLMPMISAFGDTISYIRLMAVGLASYYIASAFNMLAGGIIESAWWGIVPGVIILVLAHSMNIALCLIAIFAHAVRLNMLELSSNAGVQWAGSPYKPFEKKQLEPVGATG